MMVSSPTGNSSCAWNANGKWQALVQFDLPQEKPDSLCRRYSDLGEDALGRNEQTIAAMAEANNPAALKRYRSFRELRDRI